MGNHQGVLVKVNARVDVGVADLISALNNLPNVQTLQSCQGEPGKFDAYVYLTCGNWEATCKFLFGEIAFALKEKIDDETVKLEVFHEIVIEAKTLARPFSSSLVNQMLVTLTDAGLIYKNRHGKYSFAVPLLGEFIRRQETEATLT